MNLRLESVMHSKSDNIWEKEVSSPKIKKVLKNFPKYFSVFNFRH